jgi:hypothetical protein
VDVSPVGPVLTLLGTFAGVWVVVLLFRWFQRDFVELYRRELAEERAKREAAERTADQERTRRQAAEGREAHLRYLLGLRGITTEEEGPPYAHE